MTEPALTRPRLATGVRLHWDRVRERHVLLYPEGALVLNPTAAEALDLCDGSRTFDDIADVLSGRYDGADVRSDVEELVASIAGKGLVVDADA